MSDFYEAIVQWMQIYMYILKTFAFINFESVPQDGCESSWHLTPQNPSRSWLDGNKLQLQNQIKNAVSKIKAQFQTGNCKYSFLN